MRENNIIPICGLLLRMSPLPHWPLQLPHKLRQYSQYSLRSHRPPVAAVFP